MEHIAPLLQTVLWVGLLGIALWRFHEPLHGLLVALQRRIESGSNIKAGPFELSDQLKPQDPSKQREKTAIEVAEVLQEQPLEQSPPLPQSNSLRAAEIQAKYFQAEDLVLRAIQAEYGATVSRQVTAGADMGFDGAFVSNGRLNIVEVKYLQRSASNISKFLHTVDRIAESVTRYGWRNAQIILAVVVENAEDVAKVTTRLQNLMERKKQSIEVVVRCYNFAELQEKFGVARAAGG